MKSDTVSSTNGGSRDREDERQRLPNENDGDMQMSAASAARGASGAGVVKMLSAWAGRDRRGRRGDCERVGAKIWLCGGLVELLPQA